MKLEEFYNKLREIYEEHPGALFRALKASYWSYSSLGMGDMLLGYTKSMWMKKICIAVVIDRIMDDLLLEREKMSMPKQVLEALKHLTQEDFDTEFEDISKKVREVLTSK
jgi:hypothetical protein